MLKKSLQVVLTFGATTHAMASEQLLESRGLPGRLIPVPREITAGCGLAWKAPPEARDTLLAALEAAGIPWENAHILEV